MKKKPVYMSDLHFEHIVWKSEIDFQKGEIKSFTNRLEELVGKWTNEEVLSKIEQFQNKFIRHNEVLDILSHDITVHEDGLSTFAKSNPIAVDHVHFDDHTKMRDEFEMQHKLYTEMKRKFLRFLTEVM